MLSFQGIVYASFTFDMTPADYVDAAYTACAFHISDAFINKRSEINPILSLSAQGSCPTVSSSSVTYDSTLKNGFVCTTHAGTQVGSDSKTACCEYSFY